jgi:hypothetical protein
MVELYWAMHKLCGHERPKPAKVFEIGEQLSLSL